jgi:hypothetical protein
MASPHSDPPNQTAIVDVSTARLIDLMESRDPVLIASVEELISLLDRSSEVRQGWDSAITFE